MKSRWSLLRKTNGGHKFFQCVQTLKIALADQSGTTPENTEDGILWLDSSRPVQVGLSYSRMVAVCPVVVDRNGEAMSTFITVDDALWLAKQFNMQVEVDSRLNGLRELFSFLAEREGD